jgi:acyl-CoA reductase-like NAD-dependent aldehyde dehydrogenase
VGDDDPQQDRREWEEECQQVGPTVWPVLSVNQCTTWDEVIAIENANQFGSAACIYTSIGANADWFLTRLLEGMLGMYTTIVTIWR